MAKELFYSDKAHVWIYPKGIKINSNNEWYFAWIEDNEMKMIIKEELFLQVKEKANEKQ